MVGHKEANYVKLLFRDKPVKQGFIISDFAEHPLYGHLDHGSGATPIKMNESASFEEFNYAFRLLSCYLKLA